MPTPLQLEFRKRRQSRRVNQNVQVMLRKRNAPTNRQLNKKIKRLQRDEEVKFEEQAKVLEEVTNSQVAPYFNPLNLILQGDSNRQRNGNEIRATSLLFKYTFYNKPAVTTATDVVCRVMLFWDRQANGANPGIIGGDSTNALLTNTLITEPTLMYRNINYLKRYKVLYDRSHVLKIGAFGSANVTAEIHKTVRVRLNRYIKYDDTAASVAAIATNSLWMAAFTDKPSGDEAPYIDWTARIYFKDA